MFTKISCLLVIIFLAIVQQLQAYPYFRDQIPNGYNVGDPCYNGSIWMGVGHMNIDGGGPRNPFGLDFFKNGKIYNATLCEMDSDEDGRTNGEELGDPDCVWSPGKTPSRTEGITHPGICEPIDSEKCMGINNWLTCDQFNCTAFNEPGTKRLDLIFPRFEVPDKDTVYLCYGVQLPSDKKYHIVGETVILNTTKYLHHIVLYGCNRPVTEQEMTTPHECEVTVPLCQSVLAIWTPGVAGFCYTPEWGFAIGQGGFQYALLQAHIFNPDLISGDHDQPGLALYYTDVLRPYDAAILTVGQLYLNIPPGQPLVEAVGRCKAECTNSLGTRKLKIVGALLHMHMIGTSIELYLIRNGVETLIDEDQHFNANRPRLDFFDPYFDFEAGDEMKTICRYNSTGRKTPTLWQFSTAAEMCIVLVVVIPYTANLTSCLEYKTPATQICSLNDSVTYSGCDVAGLQTSFVMIGQTCDLTCSPNCIASIRKMNDTNCFNIDLGGYIRFFWGYQFAGLSQLFQLTDYCSAMAPPMISSSPSNSGSSLSMASSPNPSAAQGSTMANSMSSAGSGGQNSMSPGGSGGQSTMNPGGSGGQSSQGNPGGTDSSGGSKTPSPEGGGEGKKSHKGRTIAAVLISSLSSLAVAVSIVVFVCFCYAVVRQAPIVGGRRKLIYNEDRY